MHERHHALPVHHAILEYKHPWSIVIQRSRARREILAMTDAVKGQVDPKQVNPIEANPNKVNPSEPDLIRDELQAHPIEDLKSTSLDDKYDLTKPRIFVSGAQAVTRLLLMQKELDRRAGLRTAGFISGYRGSPLGGLDLTFQRARRQFEANDISF